MQRIWKKEGEGKERKKSVYPISILMNKYFFQLEKSFESHSSGFRFTSGKEKINNFKKKSANNPTFKYILAYLLIFSTFS